MRLQTIKKDSDLVLEGVKFDVQWSDGNIAQVLATDAKGNLVAFKVESYSFKALVKAPPKKVKKFLLAGTVAGVPVESFYDDKYDAENAKREHERMVSSDEYCSLEVSSVEVEEADA